MFQGQWAQSEGLNTAPACVFWGELSFSVCVPVQTGGTHHTAAAASMQCHWGYWYSTPCYLRPILGSFMVKQDFKNNPVIGMSAAALLHQARMETERRGAIRIKSHLALEMKTFSRLLWLMSHITEAKIEIFWAFLLLSSLFFVTGHMLGLIAALDR